VTVGVGLDFLKKEKKKEIGSGRQTKERNKDPRLGRGEERRLH